MQSSDPIFWLTWYDKGINGVICTWLGLRFDNGQEIGSFSEGRKIEIYRPTLGEINPGSPRSFMRITASADDGFWYGDRDNSLNGMEWSVELNSKYGGEKGITQLTRFITQDQKNTLWGWRNVKKAGANELDNHEFISRGQYLPNNPQAQIRNYDFHDYPGLGFDDSGLNSFIIGAYVQVSFVDYIRFRPFGQHNIHVTLGTVSWTAYGRWSASEGITENDTPEPEPVQDSIEFPVWDKVYKNSP